jgi:hypothetical protein
MTEEFLQYLWKYRLLNQDLHARGGDPVTVIHPGEHNQNSGPDFLNARVRIGDTLWAGNVEVHMHETDWFRHHHDSDKVYDNVILHVIHDTADHADPGCGREMPVLVVKGQFPQVLLERYEHLVRNQSWIPCEPLIHQADPFYFREWASALVIERIMIKCNQWENLLEANKFDWAETLHQIIAQAFGLKINMLPFELLAKAVPLKLILKHRNDLISIESLVFGQAGMLDREFSESYPLRLKEEYRHLSAKYSLKPMDQGLWKFLRLRPSSFPTVRIAQWAAILQHADRFFPVVTESRSPDPFEKLFTVGASEYWNTHFMFERLSPSNPKMVGTSTIRLIMLNAVIPFLFFYGNNRGQDAEKEKALHWLGIIPGEDNHLISKWRSLGMPSDSAFFTQALLQVKSQYCERKKCLECRIGRHLLANGGK